MGSEKANQENLDESKKYPDTKSGGISSNLEKKWEHIESRNNPNVGVADIVKSMWYDWKKVRVDLAIRATGKYISYKEDKEWNKKQNEAIRAKILSWEEFKPELEKSISKFPISKQEKIRQLVWTKKFPITAVDSFVSKIPQNKIEKLNNLSDENFIGFLHEELVSSNNVKEKLSKEYWSKVLDTTNEQLANIVELTKIDEKLQDFIGRNPELAKYQEQATTIVVAEVAAYNQEKNKLEQDITVVVNEVAVAVSPEQKSELEAKRKELEDKSKKLEEGAVWKLYNQFWWSTELVKKALVVNQTTALISKSEEFKALPPEEKQEFDQILVDVYRYNENVSPELNEMYFPGMNSEIEQKEREINQISLNISESFTDSQKTILENKEFNNYFKDNYIDEFVSEDQKDQTYRDNLQKFYPDSKKLIQASFVWISDYQSCFDEAGNINKNELEKLPKDKQDIFSAKVKEKLNVVDEELVGNINNVVKEQSVETCLATLSKCMNIKFDDGTKEDMIKNFNFSSQMNDNLVLDFSGTLNGKKINLSYNMLDGKVFYDEYLYKDKSTNTFKKSDSNFKTEMSFVELPKLSDFILASKSLDYAREMWNAKNIDDFNSSIKDRLNSQVQKNIDIKDARENFEKSMLQDIAMQEMFSFMWYGEDKNFSDIDPREEPNLYRLYSMIYESICFYSKDELNYFRDSITTLMTQKSKISPDYNNLNVWKEQLEKDMKLNEERVFFELSMNDSIYKSSWKKDSESNSYLWFFECFIQEETNPPLYVIDLSEMKDYMWKLDKEVNNDSENVLEWKRNNIFKKNLWRIRDNYDVLMIEKSF